MTKINLITYSSPSISKPNLWIEDDADQSIQVHSTLCLITIVAGDPNLKNKKKTWLVELSCTERSSSKIPIADILGKEIDFFFLEQYWEKIDHRMQIITEKFNNGRCFFFSKTF